MICEICLKAFASARALRTTPPKDAVFGDHGWACPAERPNCFPHHPTFLSLKASVDLHCLVCTTIWKLNEQTDFQLASQLDFEASLSVLPEGRHESSESPGALGGRLSGTRLGIGTAYRRLGPGFKVFHSVLLDGYNSAGGRCEIDLYLEPEAENKTPEDDTACSTSLESLETFSAGVAKRWIKDCIENHASCGTSSIWHPTRLLDSGPLEPVTGDHIVTTVHLVEPGPTATSIEGHYMTLSYRWGSSASLVLNKQTYPALVAGLDWKSLPQAFRDAIFVCRGLGIRYLWIDALCILQDDPTDWQREAGQMHKVYSNSFCNISATHGEGSSAPFLKTNSLYLNQVKINRQTENGDITASTYYICIQDMFKDHVVKAPVNKRAWVLQERMLSPRVLHFTDTQMFWDCFEHQACETHSRGLAESAISAICYGTTLDYKFLPFKDNDGGTAMSQDDLMVLHKQWVNIVLRYTVCDITVPTDKLIAISALARRFASYFQDDYVAGMWRRSLASDLLWSMDPPQRPKDQGSPEVYVAPSWSWASTTGAVRVPSWCTEGFDPKAELDGFRENRFLACVEDVHIDYASDADHFGVVRGGRLRLHGVLQSAQLKLVLEHPPRATPRYRVVINNIVLPLLEDHDLERAVGYGHAALDRHLYEDHLQALAGMLFCMLIVKSQSELPPQVWRQYLLLEVVHDAPMGTFQRIGKLFILPGFRESAPQGASSITAQEYLTEQLSTRHAHEANFPCVEYRDGKHVIWVI